MGKGKKVAITGFGVAMLFVLAFAIFWFRQFTTVVVTGPSMLPTFENGQRLLVSKAYWLVGPIRVGDVVVIRGEDTRSYMIKRVHRMAGEAVDLANAPSEWQLTQGEYVVPAGEIYVLGDNRSVSEDSRKYGSVALSRVIGKVVLRP
jgi:signal peptidase I